MAEERSRPVNAISAWLDGCSDPSPESSLPLIIQDDTTSINSDGTPSHSSNASNYSIEQNQYRSGPREALLDMALSKKEVEQYGLLISRSNRKPITVGEVQDHILIPDYPHTSNIGIAHFLHMPYLLNQTESFEDQEVAVKKIGEIASKIQFGLRQACPIRKTSLALLGKVGGERAQAWVMQYSCTGIKHCEYALPDMLRPCEAYSRVELQTLDKLRQQTSQQNFPFNLTSQVKRQTELIYQSYLQNWCQNKYHCTNVGNNKDCCEDAHLTMFLRKGIWRIGCSFSNESEPWHTATTIIQNTATFDIRYLKALIDFGYNGPQTFCTLAAHRTLKKPLCGFDHPQGQGRVLTCNCSATLDIYIPFKITRFRYYLLVARGEHMHHPPQPVKLPLQVAQEVKELLDGTDLLNLTPRRLLISQQLQEFLSKHKVSSLTEIHNSLNCQDRLAALIKKQRILRYPQGRDLAGVIREASIDANKELDEQWIRDFSVQEDFFIIICFHLKQAQAFHMLKTFQMDLSFKAIRGPVNCFSIVAFDEVERRTKVFLRAYLSRDTRKAYFHMFQLLFKAVENVTKQKVIWHHIHIHQGGIGAVVVDMCKKQAGGFGDYLHTLDPSKEWHEHLQHMLIFCDVHVRRNLRKRFPNHPLLGSLQGLFDVMNREDLNERMRRICQTYPELHGWIRNKQVPWILSGLCKWVSKVDTEIFEITQRNTNLGESSHFMDNEFTGRGLSFLGAVMGHKRADMQRFNKAHVLQDTGIADTWRNISFINRHIQAHKKKDKYARAKVLRKKQKKQYTFDPFNAYDVEEPEDVQHTPSISDANTESRASNVTSEALGSSITGSAFFTAHADNMPPPSTPHSKRIEGTQKERREVEKKVTLLKEKIQLRNRQKELEELEKEAGLLGIDIE